MDDKPHDLNDPTSAPKPKQPRREKVDDLWNQYLNNGDFDGLLRMLVYDTRLLGHVPEYQAKIIGLVETLAANDVDNLIDTIYRQNLAAVSRWLIQARIKMERLHWDRSRGLVPASDDVANTLQQHAQEWEWATDRFTLLAQKYLGVRDALKRKSRTKADSHQEVVDSGLASHEVASTPQPE